MGVKGSRVGLGGGGYVCVVCCVSWWEMREGGTREVVDYEGLYRWGLGGRGGKRVV